MRHVKVSPALLKALRDHMEAMALDAQAGNRSAEHARITLTLDTYGKHIPAQCPRSCGRGARQAGEVMRRLIDRMRRAWRAARVTRTMRRESRRFLREHGGVAKLDSD